MALFSRRPMGRRICMIALILVASCIWLLWDVLPVLVLTCRFAEGLSHEAALLAYAEGNDRHGREDALWALGSVSLPRGITSMKLLERLKHEDNHDLQLRIIMTLCDIEQKAGNHTGSDAHSDSLGGGAVVLVLGKLLRDEEATVRRRAALVLNRLPACAIQLSGQLLESVNDDDVSVRVTCAETLGQIMRTRQQVIPGIEKALTSWDVDICIIVALAILDVSHKNVGAQKIIIGALTDADDNDVAFIALQLACLGGRARFAVGPLEELARSDKRELQNIGIRALAAIDPARHVPELLKGVRGSNESIAVTCIQAIGDLGAGARPAISELTECLRRSKRIRKFTVQALGSIGRCASEVAPVLAEALRDPDKEIRLLAAEGLGRMGPTARIATREIMTALDFETDRTVQLHLRRTLEDCGINVDGDSAQRNR